MGLILPALALFVVFGILFLWLVYTGRQKRAQESGYKNISPQEAKERLKKEKNIVIVDVRSEEEYNAKHIPGSIVIPLETLEREAPAKLIDKNSPIFVYCHSGRRSISASRKLAHLGYTQVYNLGGIRRWPYETRAHR